LGTFTLKAIEVAQRQLTVIVPIRSKCFCDYRLIIRGGALRVACPLHHFARIKKGARVLFYAVEFLETGNCSVPVAPAFENPGHIL
jgi:hypothetical protein